MKNHTLTRNNKNTTNIKNNKMVKNNPKEKRKNERNEYFLIVNTLFRHYLSRDLHGSPLR